MDLLELIMSEPRSTSTVTTNNHKRISFTRTRDTLPEMKSFSNTRTRLSHAKRRASL